MKNIIAILLFPILVLSWASCKTDFEIAAPYKPITVVYGLLSQNDSAHYVRIQKAFLDGQKSAVLLSKIPDSSYWKNIDVVVREMNGTTVVANIPLNRVDLATEGYVKKPGDSLQFFTSPNYAYKFKRALNPAYTYRLVITNNDTKEIDSAETPIIDKNFSNNTLDASTWTIDFSRPTTNSIFRIAGFAPKHARYFQTVLRIHYVDKNNTSGVQTDKSVDFRLPQDILVAPNTNASYEFGVPHRSFYEFMNSALPAVTDGSISRFLDSADAYVYAGGEELYNYAIINATQGTGLTSDQIQTRYTNIKGENVLGLFSTRAYRSRFNVPITLATLDTLKVNTLTAPLLFKGFSDH